MTVYAPASPTGLQVPTGKALFDFTFPDGGTCASLRAEEPLSGGATGAVEHTCDKTVKIVAHYVPDAPPDPPSNYQPMIATDISGLDADLGSCIAVYP